MQPIHTLIIDDNKLARMGMAQLAMQVKDLSVVGECATAMEAYQIMQEQSIQLLLLDIEMPEMTGIELTKLLGQQRPVIIFTTGKMDYAVEAFELNVADYIIKPVTPARFLQAIEKAREIINSRKETVSIEAADFVFIRDNGVLKRIALNDILYMEAMGDYVKLYTGPKFNAIHTTLKSMEEKLPAAQFLRVHRSYMVALNKIDSIVDGVIQINKAAIPVADAYRAALNKRLNLL
ncbi:LytTR family DNA-binding domain-containing protein [soil metagenome]